MSTTNQLGPVIRDGRLSADAPDGWSVTFGDELPSRLTPGRSAEVAVDVEVPASAEGGTYRIPVVLTDAKKRSSQGTLVVDVPKTEDEDQG